MIPALYCGLALRQPTCRSSLQMLSFNQRSSAESRFAIGCAWPWVPKLSC